ncbi:hypothetical protein B0H14DRAFT_3488941 [Mycena olivaceomarginata]|nr:hypothetical protein B0H14DRAFT_3488941 [Mycena olivaceomarginata]
MSAAYHRSNNNHDRGHGDRSNDEGMWRRRCKEQERIQRFLGVVLEDEDNGKAGAEEVGHKAVCNPSDAFNPLVACVQCWQEGKSCIIRSQGKAIACDECARRKRRCSFVLTKELEGSGAARRSGACRRGGGDGHGVREESLVDPKLISEGRNQQEGQGLAIGGLQSGPATYNCTLDVQEERLRVVTTALWDFFQDFLVETTREAFIERANLHIPAMEAQTSRQSQPEPQRREWTGPERRRVYRWRSVVDLEEEPEAEERIDVDKNTEDLEEGGASAE